MEASSLADFNPAAGHCAIVRCTRWNAASRGDSDQASTIRKRRTVICRHVVASERTDPSGALDEHILEMGREQAEAPPDPAA